MFKSPKNFSTHNTQGESSENPSTSWDIPGPLVVDEQIPQRPDIVLPDATVTKDLTVKYYAKIQSGNMTAEVPINAEHVTGPEKAIIDQSMKTVWNWIVDNGLHNHVSLRAAFDLSKTIEEEKEADETHNAREETKNGHTESTGIVFGSLPGSDFSSGFGRRFTSGSGFTQPAQYGPSFTPSENHSTGLFGSASNQKAKSKSGRSTSKSTSAKNDLKGRSSPKSYIGLAKVKTDDVRGDDSRNARGTNPSGVGADNRLSSLAEHPYPSSDSDSEPSE